MAKIGVFEALDELRTVLKGINGSPNYWNNLENRVYRQLITPEDGGEEITRPYLCMPKVGDDPDYEWAERGVKVTFKQPIYGFVDEDDTAGTEAKAPERVDKLHDDVLKAILLTPTLNGKVSQIIIVPGGGAAAGVLTDDSYGELEMVAEMFLWVDSNDLGPP